MKLFDGIKIIILSLFYLGISMPLLSNAAAPTVVNVSGSVQTGQILIITGTNMVNENKANWDPFFTSNANASGFEGSNPASDGYSAIGPSDGIYDSTVKIMGNKSVKFHVNGSSSNCPNGNLTSYNAMAAANGSGSVWYMRAYVRYHSADGTWPTSQIKMLYPWAHGSVEYEPFDSTGNLPAQMDLEYPGAGGGLVSHQANIPSGQLLNDRWYCTELRIGSDHSVQAWVDGQSIHNGTSTDDSGNPYLLFGIVNLCGTGSSFSLDNWVDGLVLSSTRVYPAAVVEISNNPTYGSGTKVYQEPVYLSDSSIQIKVNLSGLGSGPYYLWITNNQQQRSGTYSLSGGGGSNVTPQPPGVLTAH